MADNVGSPIIVTGVKPDIVIGFTADYFQTPASLYISVVTVVEG